MCVYKLFCELVKEVFYDKMKTEQKKKWEMREKRSENILEDKILGNRRTNVNNY